jgi:purine-binding chemotaxis protein CheW
MCDVEQTQAGARVHHRTMGATSTETDDRNAALSLLCRVQSRLCALPLECVLETMRPLPIEPLSGAPQFVRGLAIIRGEPVPVVDTARLLGTEETRPARFVAVKAGARRVALAVDSVLGVRSIPAGSLQELPSLLGDAAADIVSAIGILDAELLLVLHSARLVPEEVWARLDADGAPS